MPFYIRHQPYYRMWGGHILSPELLFYHLDFFSHKLQNISLRYIINLQHNALRFSIYSFPTFTILASYVIVFSLYLLAVFHLMIVCHLQCTNLIFAELTEQSYLRKIQNAYAAITITIDFLQDITPNYSFCQKSCGFPHFYFLPN